MVGGRVQSSSLVNLQEPVSNTIWPETSAQQASGAKKRKINKTIKNKGDRKNSKNHQHEMNKPV